MKKINKLILLLILTIFSFKAYAHKNVNVTKTFGNVNIIFSTGYYYEEINKALIIGEYAKNISTELNFNNKITIWFRHIYTKHQSNSYIIRHDLENNKKSNEIFLELYDTEYNIQKILKLVEYSIVNINNFDRIDGLEVLKKYKKSKIVKTILKQKIYRPSYVKELLSKNNGVSYYYQENKYHIYIKTQTSEKEIISLNNIYQFDKIDEYSNIVFETNKVFYIFQNTNLNNPTDKCQIKNIEAFETPYKIRLLTPNVLSMVLFSKSKTRKDRIILLLIKEKKIIQNLELILGNG